MRYKKKLLPDVVYRYTQKQTVHVHFPVEKLPMPMPMPQPADLFWFVLQGIGT